MNKLLLLTSASLFCLSSAFSSDRVYREQQGQSVAVNPSSVSAQTDENQEQNNITPNHPAPSTPYSSLRDMPPEVLGQIAGNLSPKNEYKFQNMIGNNLLTAKTQQKGFYSFASRVRNGKVIEFDLRQDGDLKVLKYFLETHVSAPIKLRLTGVTVENINEILPHCQNVSSLDLEGNGIGDAGAQAIAASATLTNLTTLNLSWNQIGDAGAQAIAASTTLSNLTDLNLGRNRIGDAGVRAIAASPTLSSLTSLVLMGNQIGGNGAVAIAASTEPWP